MITIDSSVEDFYTAQTLPGIQNAIELKSIGLQFFTWGGPWSGKLYIDDVQIVDTLTQTASLHPFV